MNQIFGSRRRSHLVVGALSLFLLLPMETTLAQEVARTLTVTGEGIERIATTLAEVNLGVEIRGKTAAEAQQEAAKRSTAVINLLQQQDVERLQTTGIGLQPVYDYSDDNRRLVGYVATNTVSFRLATEQVGSLLDQVVQAGATRIDSISFTATETAITEAQQEALRLAVQDAQQQAQAVFQTLELTPQEIVSININGAEPPKPQFREVAELSAAADSTPVVGGEQTVRAAVTLQISY